MPISETPSWLITKIELRPNTIIVIADDSDIIHQIWRNKLINHRKVKSVIYIDSLKELEDFVTKTMFSEAKTRYEEKTTRNETGHGAGCDEGKILYIIDNHFKDRYFSGTFDSGVMLIERYHLEKQAILCTGQALRDGELAYECKILGIKLLPKEFVSLIEVV